MGISDEAGPTIAKSREPNPDFAERV